MDEDCVEFWENRKVRKSLTDDPAQSKTKLRAPTHGGSSKENFPVQFSRVSRYVE